MKKKTALGGPAALTAALLLPAAPSQAAMSSGPALAGATLAAGATPMLGSSSDDRAIRRAFEDVLDREPTDRELDKYRTLMREADWSEADVRDDLREQRGSRSRDEDPDRIVRRAYRDILDREPDEAGLRLYRSRILDDDWTEEQVRDALRKSPEKKGMKAEEADKVIRRAYEDLLGREPDQAGLASYRNRMMNQGWDERQVRDALRKSPEYRQKTTMTPQKAQEIVRRAYLSVLGREPDAGSRGYVDKVLRERWTEERVAEELKKSPEYRGKQ